jgi:hypothetical protein
MFAKKIFALYLFLISMLSTLQAEEVDICIAKLVLNTSFPQFSEELAKESWGANLLEGVITAKAPHLKISRNPHCIITGLGTQHGIQENRILEVQDSKNQTLHKYIVSKPEQYRCAAIYKEEVMAGSVP